MPTQRYSYTAITLHWLIALLLAFQIALGWALEGNNGPELFARYQLHKSIGISILLLSLARLAVRLFTPRPPASDGPAWTRMLAGIVHGLFYLVMILGPVTGWLLVSTARVQVPTLLYGLVPWPHLPVGRALHEPAESIHGAMAWLAIGLFLLHIIGALRHQWLLGKPDLQRMIPFARGKAVGAAIGALALVGGAFALGQTVYPERSRPVVVKAPPMPTAAPVAPQAVPAAPLVEDKAPVEDATKEAPVEAKEPLADWTVASGGRLGFTARWNGEAVRGSFGRWRAAIRFSPDVLARSNIRVTVDLASADTGDGQRDDSLKSSDFFNVTAQPNAIFTARDIRHIDGDRYEARGTLDLRGVSKPVTLRFTLRIEGNKARVAGTARIDRTAFGVGQGEWAATDAIAAGVDVDFSFSATRPTS
ncbi:cytochrome b561/polyisoprenoid-binding protein YceI [Sphingopyxis italica]|uniref:Cytochrome b561/polyisoprenoid-binding protein YceI n=1 Tax=Sphingopyxis italica TaxID=1129133 RepID=A0A7X5XTU9_9SPHN|nr:YceI family protein [Sphingopyxis italica]NJB89722.1 cytochrome b561/polyisoprenoid-binding protein YceI [Sphingopyxis italica]